MFSRIKSKIHAHSIDADGCLLNEIYQNNLSLYRDKLSVDADSLILANACLIKSIEAMRTDADGIILFVGSARQDPWTDMLNNYIHESGSCYAAMEILQEHLRLGPCEIVLDRMLIADLEKGKEEGFHFDWDQTELWNKVNEETEAALYLHRIPCFSHRQNKFLILYAQMHKIAGQYPDHQIEFFFYDDDQAILAVLFDCFRQTDYIPENVSLRLKLYDGEALHEYCALQGTGDTEDYRKRVFWLINYVQEFPWPEDNSKPAVSLSHHVRENEPWKLYEILDEHRKSVENEAYSSVEKKIDYFSKVAMPHLGFFSSKSEYMRDIFDVIASNPVLENSNKAKLFRYAAKTPLAQYNFFRKWHTTTTTKTFNHFAGTLEQFENDRLKQAPVLQYKDLSCRMNK